MTEFYLVNISDETIKRAPGRLLYASMSMPFPASIGEVVNLSTYIAQSLWTEGGATKGGIQIGYNNAETELTVDQIRAAIQTLPDTVDMFVQTALSETSIDRFAFAWEGDTVVTNSAGLVTPEKQSGFGPFEGYTRRRLAVGFRNPNSGKLMLWAFRQVTRAPQESTITMQQTGDQMTIPVRFRCLPDTSISTVKQRFSMVWEQQ